MDAAVFRRPQPPQLRDHPQGRLDGLGDPAGGLGLRLWIDQGDPGDLLSLHFCGPILPDVRPGKSLTPTQVF